jgi:hypothetical protein
LEALLVMSSALLGEFPLLHLPSLVLSASSELYWSSFDGCFVALLFAGGYFTAILLRRMLCRRRRVCDRFGWMLCHLSIFTPLALYFLLAGSVIVVTRFADSSVSSPSFLLFSVVVLVARHLLGVVLYPF